MGNYIKLIALGGVTLFAAIAANWGRDVAYIVHAMIILAVSAFLFVRVLRQMDEPVAAMPDGYMDDVVRAGVIATGFWGVVGFLVGVVIAAIILLPEAIAAIIAARKNRLQTSINLALGSALASIGLTIPSVAAVCVLMDMPIILGLDIKSIVLLALSVFTVMLSLSKGKSNVVYGVVLLVNLFAFIFLMIYP